MLSCLKIFREVINANLQLSEILSYKFPMEIYNLLPWGEKPQLFTIITLEREVEVHYHKESWGSEKNIFWNYVNARCYACVEKFVLLEGHGIILHKNTSVVDFPQISQ